MSYASVPLLVHLQLIIILMIETVMIRIIWMIETTVIWMIKTTILKGADHVFSDHLMDRPGPWINLH